jgi:hypothetical protein
MGVGFRTDNCCPHPNYSLNFVALVNQMLIKFRDLLLDSLMHLRPQVTRRFPLEQEIGFRYSYAFWVSHQMPPLVLRNIACLLSQLIDQAA